MKKGTYDRGGARCPYCEFLHEPAEYPELYDEDIAEFECANCDKLFEVTAYIKRAWSCNSPEEEQ